MSTLASLKACIHFIVSIIEEPMLSSPAILWSAGNPQERLDLVCGPMGLW